MKTRVEKAKKVVAFWVLVFSAIFITLNMNACGSKKNGDGGGGGSPGPIGPVTCPTCPVGAGSLLATGFGDNNQVALGLQIVAAGSGAQASSYSGPVNANGFFQVKQQFSCNVNMILPPGIYSVTTVQPGSWYGQWSFSAMENLKLQANGPVQVVLIAGNSTNHVWVGGTQVPNIGPQGEPYNNYLDGPVLVESVNGQPCNFGGPLVQQIN